MLVCLQCASLQHASMHSKSGEEAELRRFQG